jgi:hypothetical protein
MERKMSHMNNVGMRILTAQADRCEELAAELAAARVAGVSATKLDDLEAQLIAARNRYQELAVDISNQGSGSMAGRRRPWWRFW